MTLVMTRDINSSSDGDDDSGSGRGNGSGSGNGSGAPVSRNNRKYECDNCRAEFPNKTTADRHMLFCRTLAEIRRGSGAGGGGVSFATHTVAADDDALMPTPREMFILIQELAAKYNKVKDELDVMKQWAKMVGRRIGGGAGSSSTLAAGAGLDFTSISRQKRQNMEVILNEEDADRPDLAELRPGFAEWLAAPDLANALTDADLNVVFNEDLVAGITAAILRVLAGYTAESRRSHLVPFKLADIKQGAFYIYDTAFSVGVAGPAENATDLPTQARKWRAMESCEFQLLVRTFHKLLLKEFKKWQDRNWEAQRELTKQRQKAASSYQQMISSAQQPKPQYQCSPAMMSCDGMYPMPGAGAVDAGVGVGAGAGAGQADDVDVDADVDVDVEDPMTPVGGIALSEDFATLYNKYADKMLGGALSDETILSRVRAKLWKDMKAWRL
jgi:hypothetical protein